MRILLIAPPQWAAYGLPRLPVYPPLGLLQVAACLTTEGHAVRLVDADAEGVGIRVILRRILRWRPDLVGLTATTPAFPEARRWAARIRSETGSPVVIGGPHASALPRDILATECFDGVVTGEAEPSLGQVIRRLVQGCGGAVPGLWLPGEEPVTGHEPAVLDDLPLPSWHLVRRPDRYLPPDARALPVGTVMLSRGCPGGCRFCQTTRLFGAKVRYLSPERAVEHVHNVHRAIAAREIHLIDDCLTADKARAVAIMEALARGGPRLPYAFGNGLRSDMLDDDLLEAMRDLGVHSFGIGIETADDALALGVGKRRDLDATASVVEKAHRFGMTVWGFFMLGLPGETGQTLSRTARLAQELDLDVAKFEIFKPYPGTALYEEMAAQGALASTSWADWGIHTPPVHRGLVSSREVWRMRRRAVLSFHLRPRALRAALVARRTRTQTMLNLQAARFLLHTVTSVR